jgi:pyruvate/2-oxoglutarate dehydrogenase complex dihydrolipoamide dehydrogenase (E3) component
MSSKVDVVILGAGPAGALAAARAVELGARTALVTQGNIGGMAANDGPVPVRTLAHTARLMRDARQLGEYGVAIDEPVLDYSQMLRRVGVVVNSVRELSSFREQIESQGGTIYENVGPAQFVDSHNVATETGLQLSAEKFIICTGGVSKKLPIPGFEFTSTHSDAWSLTGVPPSLIVVGAGATGAQVASIFNAFGSRIQLFDASSHILPSEDDDIAAAMADAFRQAGMVVREGFGAIESFEKSPAGVRMTFSKDGHREYAEAALAIVAVGWAADTGALNLNAAGVDLTQRGFVRVNEYLQTSAPHIFAAGDVTGRIMLASEGARDGFVAGSNAVRDTSSPVSSHLTPTGSFTDPEYASVGLTEKAARENRDVETVVVNFDSTTRAIIDGKTFGFCKLIVDRKTNEILGCHVVGERAVDIVQLASVALTAGMRRVDHLARVAVSFPTYAEILIYTAVKAALQLNLEIGWRTHYRA